MWHLQRWNSHFLFNRSPSTPACPSKLLCDQHIKTAVTQIKAHTLQIHTETLKNILFFGKCIQICVWIHRERERVMGAHWLSNVQFSCLSFDVLISKRENKWAALIQILSAFESLEMITSIMYLCAWVRVCVCARLHADMVNALYLFAEIHFVRAAALICSSVQQPSYTEFQLLDCARSLAKSGYYLSLSWTQCTDRLTGNTIQREKWQAITGEVLVGDSATVLE